MNTPEAISLVVALVGAIALAVWASRKPSRERNERARFIEQYRFPDELRRRLSESYPGFMPRQLDQVLAGLRQYFLACLKAQREGIAGQLGMPSRAVDEAWHEFIVMTRDYADFCTKAFGKYLHHTPKAQMTQPTQDALANTLHQLKSGSPTTVGWATIGAMPLIFALDRELGLKDGHLYDEQALARLDAHRQSMVASSGGGETSASHSSDDRGGAGDGGSDGGGGSCGGGGGCGGS